jgi:signal transduction histidine kinase
MSVGVTLSHYNLDYFERCYGMTIVMETKVMRRGVAGCILGASTIVLVALVAIGPGEAILVHSIAVVTAVSFLAASLTALLPIHEPSPPASADTATENQPDTDALVQMLGDVLVVAARETPVAANLEHVELVALLKAMIGRRNTARLNLAGRPLDLHVLADRAELEKAFDILIDNALLSGVRATVRLDRGTTALVAHVDDNGPGVPRSERTHLFDRAHVPAHSDRRVRHRAELATVRQIVRAHGGDVAVTCSPEGGARFTVRLPLALVQEMPLAVAS